MILFSSPKLYNYEFPHILSFIVSPVRSTYGGYYGLVVVTPPRPRPPRPPRPRPLYPPYEVRTGDTMV